MKTFFLYLRLFWALLGLFNELKINLQQPLWAAVRFPKHAGLEERGVVSVYNVRSEVLALNGEKGHVWLKKITLDDCVCIFTVIGVIRSNPPYSDNMNRPWC